MGVASDSAARTTSHTPLLSFPLLAHTPMHFRTLLASAFSALLLARSATAAAQTIAISGSPASFRVTTAVAGSNPQPLSNSTTTYTVTTANPNHTYKVTAQLNANMPTGTTLSATFAAPPGATSSGAVALDITARDVVTAIPRNSNSTQGITYTFAATAAAGVIPSTSRTVTLTIIRFP